MAEDTLETRVARLEEQMARLMRARNDEEQPGPDEWEQTVGMFRGDPIVGEMIQEAQRIREEDRRLTRETEESVAE